MVNENEGEGRLKGSGARKVWSTSFSMWGSLPGVGVVVTGVDVGVKGAWRHIVLSEYITVDGGQLVIGCGQCSEWWEWIIGKDKFTE